MMTPSFSDDANVMALSLNYFLTADDVCDAALLASALSGDGA